MSAPGFTPGPYRAHPYSIKDGSRVRFEIVAKDFDGEEYVVARTADDGSRVGEATANLLAAAPDLYAALREAYEALHDIINAAGNDDPYTREELEGEFSNIAGNAWAALAKAEGRQA